MPLLYFGDSLMSPRRIWTKLRRNSSYEPPGASYTAQTPQKQPEILKTLLFVFYNKYKKWIYEKCLGPFLTIVGDMRAINPLYFLTGFLPLYPPGKREKEGKPFYNKNTRNKTKYLISLYILFCFDGLYMCVYIYMYIILLFVFQFIL